jgi:branched-chain amino acid aminotransferase
VTEPADPQSSSGVAFVDDRFCPVEEARIPVLDLGVTRSDCTYDVAHVWRGRFYRLGDHLDRFYASMKALRLDPGLDRQQLAGVLEECVRRSGLRDAYVSMTCTRGRLAKGSRDLRTAINRFYCFAVPFVWIRTPEQQEQGASLWVSQSSRIPPESVDPTVKNYHWLDLDVAQLEAYEHGADLVALRDLDGYVTEGPGYNIFAYTGGRWITPGRGVLEGITRRSVIELLEESGRQVEQGRLGVDLLRDASEVLISSTAGGVMPITVVDGQPVGSGTPGPQTVELRRRYWDRHEDPRWSTPVAYDDPGRDDPRPLGG